MKQPEWSSRANIGAMGLFASHLEKHMGKSLATARAPETSRRTRRRLPIRAVIRLNEFLAPNEAHPLAEAGSEARAAGRLRLFAAVLARLASNRCDADSGRVK